MLCACGCGMTPKTPKSRYLPGHHLRGNPSHQRTHGLTQTTEHIIWSGMKARCNNPNDPQYHNYGGRGILVCQEWQHDFLAFLRDMGRRPSMTHTLDRIDNNAGYSKANCRWATVAEQSRSRRTSRLLTHNGKTMTTAEWGREIGLSDVAIRQRLRLGWSVSQALSPECRGSNQFRQSIKK